MSVTAAAVLPIVDKFLSVVDRLLENSNIRLEQRYVERVRVKHLSILEERQKGDLADQAKIAVLYQELSIEMDALDAAISSAVASSRNGS